MHPTPLHPCTPPPLHPFNPAALHPPSPHTPAPLQGVGVQAWGGGGGVEIKRLQNPVDYYKP